MSNDCGQRYADDYEYALGELRAGTYHTYGIISPPNGNVEAVYQAEKDYEHERREGQGNRSPDIEGKG